MSITCFFVGGSSLNLTRSVYKNNFHYDRNDVEWLYPKIPKDLGEYRIVENNFCGTDTATSVLSLCGECMCQAPNIQSNTLICTIIRHPLM